VKRELALVDGQRPPIISRLFQSGGEEIADRRIVGTPSDEAFELGFRLPGLLLVEQGPRVAEPRPVKVGVDPEHPLEDGFGLAVAARGRERVSQHLQRRNIFRPRRQDAPHSAFGLGQPACLERNRRRLEERIAEEHDPMTREGGLGVPRTTLPEQEVAKRPPGVGVLGRGGDGPAERRNRLVGPARGGQGHPELVLSERGAGIGAPERLEHAEGAGAVAASAERRAEDERRSWIGRCGDEERPRRLLGAGRIEAEQRSRPAYSLSQRVRRRPGHGRSHSTRPRPTGRMPRRLW